MWASAWNALKDSLVADAVVVAFLSAFCALLGVAALECLMANLLVVVALRRSWAPFKDAGCAGFSSSMKVSVGQEPSCITAFGQVNNH
jgi:hypothetical protein